jgi:hypothetical protein
MSKNQSNELQHVIPAQPGLMATVVSDHQASLPQALTPSRNRGKSTLSGARGGGINMGNWQVR